MYYRTNALYNYIREKDIRKFEYCSGDLWQVVYGNSYCEPKLLVVISGVNASDINLPISVEEEKAFRKILDIANQSNIPSMFIRFTVDQDMESVYKYTEKNEFQQISLEKLKDIYSKYDLPINNSQTGKYLNDRTSSAYHNWQRDSLGRNLKVSDIDMVKVDLNNNSILEVYELKRSKICLKDWKPYKDDYNNFKLLSNLFNKCVENIPFKIVYNYRCSDPWKDDISRLKIFNVDSRREDIIQYEKIITVDEFLNS